MKKWTAGLVVAGIVGLAFCLPASAAWQWHPVPLELRAAMGATHVAEFSAPRGDFSVSDTNTFEYFTNSIPAGYAVKCMGMVLEKAFDVATVSNICRVGLSVGDGTTTNLFLDDTELADDGTEVYVAFPPYNPAAITVSATCSTNGLLSGVALALVYATNSVVTVPDGTTTVISVASVTPTYSTTSVARVTAATATAAVTEMGYKEYASAGSIVFSFHPNADYAMDDMNAGVVRVYFKIFDRYNY